MNTLQKLIACRYDFDVMYKSSAVLNDKFIWNIMWHSRYHRYWYLGVIFAYQFGITGVNEFYMAVVKLALCYSMIYGKTVYEAHGVFWTVARLLFSEKTAEKSLATLAEKQINMKGVTKTAFEKEIAWSPTWKGIACRLSEFLKHKSSETSTQDDAIIDLIFNEEIDIEHIQAYNDKSEPAKVQQEWGATMNQIGNLAMLEYTINRSIRNDTFQDKKKGTGIVNFCPLKSF